VLVQQRISHGHLYGRLPFAKIGLGVLGQIGCSFISGLLCRRDCLLALMESADPRLISPKDWKSLNTIQALAGHGLTCLPSHFYRPCATFTAATPFFKVVDVVDAVDPRCAPPYAG
jgi:hypothetical protein